MTKPSIWGAKTSKPIATKFCMLDAVRGVITRANFREGRFRGFGVARGRILAILIDLLRRLKTLSHHCASVLSRR